MDRKQIHKNTTEFKHAKIMIINFETTLSIYKVVEVAEYLWTQRHIICKIKYR